MAHEVAALGLKVDPSGITEGIKALDDLAARGPKAEKAMDAVGESAAKAGKSLKTLGQGSAKGLEDVGNAAPKAADSVGRLSKSAENANSSLSKISSSASGLGKVATASAQSAKSVESLSASLAQTQKTISQMQMQLQTASAATANLGKAQSDAARNATSVASAYKAAGQQVSAYARAPEQAAVANQRLSKSMEATASAARLISSAFAISGIGLGASQIIALSDGYTKFTAQLKLATKSASDYAVAMEDVQRIAYGAQAGISEVGTLYARIANGTAELGLSQQRLADITEVVALSLKVSGATAAESSSAMLQLSQAFASGVLRGEEFNAVNEAAPRLMKALAEGIGVPIGALRKMAEEGKLTSSVLADALPKALEKVRTEADKIQTIGGAFTNLNSKMMEFVGGAGEASGAAKAIANSVLLVADNLGVVTTAFGAAALVMTGRYVGALTAAAAANRAAAVAAEATAIATTAASRAALAGSTSFQAMGASATTATFGVTAMAGATRAAGAALAFFGGPIGLAITALGVAASAFLYLRDSSEEAIKSIGGLNQPLDDLKKKLDELPPEKRISILIDVEKSGKEAVRDAQKSIEDLTNFVRVFGNYTLPAEEVRKYTDELQKTAAAGGDLTPVLKRAAEAGQVPQKVLQRWLDLAANIREARSAAANAEAALAAAGTNVGGGRGTINPPTIAEMNASARAEAQSVLQATTAYKAKAEQIAELRGQEAKLQAALNGLISTNQGASKSADDLRLRLSGVADRMAGLQKSTSSGAGAIKDTENAYKSLSNRVAEYIAQLQQEVAQGGKVTNSQKMQIQLDELLASSKSKVSKAALQALQNSIKTAAGLEQEAAAAENATKAYEDGLKWKAEWYAAQGKNLEEIKSANNRIREEIQLIGLSQDAQQALERARIEATLTVREQHLAEMQRANDVNQFSSRDQQNLEMEIALLKERLGLLDDKRVRTASVEAAKELENQWNKTSQTIGDTLADYIMGGGKDAAQYLKRLFSNLVLQPVVQTVVGGILGLGGGSAGAAGAAGGGGVSGVLNGVSNLRTLYSGLTGGFATSLGAGIASLGSTFGSAAITAFGNGMAMTATQAAAAAQAYAAAGYQSVASGIAGGAKLGATITKAVPWVAGAVALAAAFGAFRKTKVVDTGIMGTLGVEGGIHDFTQKRKSGSLFSGPKYTLVDEGVSSFDKPMQDAFKVMRNAAIDMGEILGLATGHLKDFTSAITLDSADSKSGTRGLNLMGLSEAEVQAKVQQALELANNEMAQQLIGSWEEVTTTVKGWISTTLTAEGEGGAYSYLSSSIGDIQTTQTVYKPSEYALEGEKAIETLSRLASSLGTINPALKDLNLALYEGSLAGADMAYKLSTLFGGLEGFTAATSSFYQNFYTEEEKRSKLQEKLAEAFNAINLTLPDIDASNAREQYRALAEAQDLTTESGRAAWSVIMQLGDAFASITPTMEEAAQQLEELKGRFLAVQDKYRTPEQRVIAQYDSIAGGLIGAGLRNMQQGDLSAMLIRSSKDEIYAMAQEVWNLGHLSIEARNALLDAADALADLKDAAQEQRDGLMSTLWQMTGNVQALRDKELAALDPANRALQAMIYTLGDLQNAAAEAAQKTQAAWSSWSTASNLALQYTGDTSGMQAQAAILRAQLGSAGVVDTAKLQELIGIEQALFNHQLKKQEEERQLQAQITQERLNGLRDELAAARALADAAKRLGDYARDLYSSGASGLSESDRMAALFAEYGTLKSAARSGNVDAFGKLQSVTGDYLGLAGTLASSGSDYSITAGRMAAELEALAKAQELVGQSQATGIELQMEQLTAQTMIAQEQFEVSAEVKALITKSMQEQSDIWDRENTQRESMLSLQDKAALYLSTMPLDFGKAMSPLLSGAASNIERPISARLDMLLSALSPSEEKSSSMRVPAYAVGTNVVPRDMLAQIHEGEAIIPKAFNPWAGGAGFAGGAADQALVAEIRALREQNARLEELLQGIDRSSGQLADQFDNVTAGGNAMGVEVMA